MKKLVAYVVFLLGVCASLTVLAADSPLPSDPAGRWNFFKTNYHAMPTGFKVCLIIIAALIIASIAYYKLTDKKPSGTDKPDACVKADEEKFIADGGETHGE